MSATLPSPAPFPSPSASRAEAQRHASLDYLKLALACMVVGLHANFLAEYAPLASHLTVNGLFRIAVPVFLIASGYFFHATVLRGGARVWFARMLRLYVVWMLVYAWFWVVPNQWTPVGILKVLRIAGMGYFHLWYIAGAIGAGVLVLLLARVRAVHAVTAAVLLYGCGAAIQYAGNYHLLDNATLAHLSNETWTHRNFLFMAFPFFYIGYAIRAGRVHERFTLAQLYGAALAGTLLVLLESWLNHGTAAGAEPFDNLVTLLAACPAIFLAALRTPAGAGTHSGRLALYSSGIYFVHFLVLAGLKQVVAIGPTLLTFVVIGCSAIVARLLIALDGRRGLLV